MSAAGAARRVTVRGEVQGVFFRDATRQEAERLGVAGWVRNAPDGSVEAFVEGSAEAVDALVAWMRAGGPRRARVEGIEVAAADPAGHAGFSVR